jgi:hypothetical protein
MPGKYRASAERARLFVADLREQPEVIALTEVEYFWHDRRLRRGRHRGRGHLRRAPCSLRGESWIDVLVTWNPRDFIRFGEVARLVKTPLEFQDVE